MPAQDLVDAVLDTLRASPCAALFGDTWNGTSGTQKFFADYASETADPQLIIFEPGETLTFMSPGVGNNRPYLADGTLQVSIFSSSRYTARTLGQAVANALNDAAMTWFNAQLIGFRLVQQGFIPIPATGPGIPQVFNRILTFQYEYSGSL